MAQPIRKITIVGGGTTGWLSALFFATRFGREIAAGEMVVELIESDRIPIIGVGESLSPSMPVSLAEFGVDETEFVRETDATFKVGGYFLDWEKPHAGQPSSWVNPFIALTGMGQEFVRFEVDRDDGGPDGDYGSILSPCREAIDRALGPKLIGMPSYQTVLRYSYQNDAGKFAPFMRGLATARGAVQLIDEVQGADLDERGFIGALNLERGGRHEVELVIDATGFSSVLLNRALGVPLRDYSKHLLNDRAMVIQSAYDDPARPLEAATRATARSNGWTFRVPLYHRSGNGYIFSSAHISEDAARDEFIGVVDGQFDPAAIRTIPMRIGRPERSWAGNCIALGLAAGFVEPLESSAIYSVETSLRWLHNYFPDRDFAPALAERYNQRTAAMYDELVDYIILHYHLSDRDDTQYWRDWRNEMVLTDSLKANLEVWKHAIPVRGDFPATTYFDENTYLAALLGKGFYRGRDIHPERHLSKFDWERTKLNAARTHDQALATLPDHRQLLDSIRAS